jgi:hypothetical protein
VSEKIVSEETSGETGKGNRMSRRAGEWCKSPRVLRSVEECESDAFIQ